MDSNSFCSHLSDLQSDLLIISVITDLIGWHEVLLPINEKYEKIWETNKPLDIPLHVKQQLQVGETRDNSVRCTVVTGCLISSMTRTLSYF